MDFGKIKLTCRIKGRCDDAQIIETRMSRLISGFGDNDCVRRDQDQYFQRFDFFTNLHVSLIKNE